MASIFNVLCRETRGRRRVRMAGFTLVELIMVMVLLGLLSIVVLPRLSGSSEFKSVGFHGEVVAALRYAQKSAVSHRRLVCADIAASSVTLTVAAANPASACGTSTLKAPNGDSAYASSSSAFIESGVGRIYFQPSGSVTSDGAGTAILGKYGITVKGMLPITVEGATGYVH